MKKPNFKIVKFSDLNSCWEPAFFLEKCGKCLRYFRCKFKHRDEFLEEHIRELNALNRKRSSIKGDLKKKGYPYLSQFKK